MRLSIVVPAYNEARRLPATLVEMVAYLGRNPRWLPAEILIVDDGSSDATAEVSGQVESKDGITIRCLAHPTNRGKGAAVRTGFSACSGDLLLLSDADLSTPMVELEALAVAVGDGVAIGSRAVDRRRIEARQPLYRDAMGRAFNLAVRLLALGGVRDTQCGFKLFAGGLGRELAAIQRLDGFAYDVELLCRARAWGCPIREVPVRWRHVEASRVRPLAHSAEMFRDLLRIGFWRVSGRLRHRPGSLP